MGPHEVVAKRGLDRGRGSEGNLAPVQPERVRSPHPPPQAASSQCASCASCPYVGLVSSRLDGQTPLSHPAQDLMAKVRAMLAASKNLQTSAS